MDGLSGASLRGKVVLTASRRTDLVRWYPADLMRELGSRYPPDRVHSIILITKFPAAVFRSGLAEKLAAYDQILAQVTITGWGGSEIEPLVPAPEQALRALPALRDFLGHPHRLRIRLDPLLRLADGRDNVAAACSIMTEAAAMGIEDFTTSIVTPYAKVQRRMNAAGPALAIWTPEERREVIGRLSARAAALGVRLYGCCIPELPKSACVDGRLLQELHPAHMPCRLDHPTGQRAECGCTHAVDLGWYASHPCDSGCLYCYANPRRSADP